MRQNKDSDERLMASVARGERDVLSVLIRRHANALLRFIHHMIGDRHRAEELFQDVFLAVWTKRHTYRYPCKFQSWLFGIAANRCRAEYRKTAARPTVTDIAAAEQYPASDPSPAEAAQRHERARIVNDAVAALPDQQREVLVLRIWSGLSYAEIATALGLTESTARSHMCYALNGLRKCLEFRLG